MRNAIKTALLVLVGLAIGMASTWLWCLSQEESNARRSDLNVRLVAIADRSLLLSLLDRGRPEVARKIFEHDLGENLAAAETLTGAGVLPWAFPAFAGEFREGLSRAEAYGSAHQLDPLVAEQARRVRKRLEAQARRDDPSVSR
jgi:hypothetical protein